MATRTICLWPTERNDKSRSRRAKRTAPVKLVSNNQSRIQLLRGGVGKLVCTKNFHSVKAHQAHVFYKVLVQLK